MSSNVPRAEQVRERPPAEMGSFGQLPRAGKLSLEEWQPWKALLFSPSLTVVPIDANDACSCSQAAVWSIAQPTAAYVIECFSACITCNSSLAALAGHQNICSRPCTKTDLCQVERKPWSAAPVRRRRPSLPECKQAYFLCLVSPSAALSSDTFVLSRASSRMIPSCCRVAQGMCCTLHC